MVIGHYLQMSYMYGILAVTGWIWTGIVALYLVVRLKKQHENHL